MNTPTETLGAHLRSAPADAKDVLRSLAAISAEIGDTLRCSEVRALDDDGLLLVTVGIEEVGRQVDALRVAAAAEIADRSRLQLGSGRLSAKKGCRNPSELVQRLTLVSAPKFPATATGLATGALGLDSAEAILNSLPPTLHRARRCALSSNTAPDDALAIISSDAAICRA